MNKYVAIGHWDGNENITCVANDAYTMKDFRHDLRGNAFVTYVVLTESKLAEIKAAEDTLEVFNIIRKLTSNYGRWNEIVDYLDQCFDIIEARVAAIH